MEPNDITIIFLTANKVPKKWAEFHKEKLLEAADSAPLITISVEPLNWGTNILQDNPGTAENVFKQVFRGAQAAKTEYIGIAEDDTLYPKEHFLYRPAPDTFAYNKHAYTIFTWGKPVYNWKPVPVNAVLIAPRLLYLEVFKELLHKFPKFPEGLSGGFIGEFGRRKVERVLGLTPRRLSFFSTETPVVRFHHEYGLDALARRHKKKHGAVRAHDIPHWGRAEELVKKFT